MAPLAPILPLFRLLCLRPSLAGLRVDGVAEAFPIRSDIMWLTHFSTSANFTLVNLASDRLLFDYCDLNAYNPIGVQKLLDAYNVTNTNNRWAAVAMFKDPVKSLADLCSETGTWHDSYFL